MPKAITSFTGKYRAFSNFSRYNVWPSWWPISLPPFPGNEWAFVAWKVDPKIYNLEDFLNLIERIRSAKTPGEAKKIGRKVILRPDWEEIKVDVMRELVHRKFRNRWYPELRELLLDTGDADLIEGNTWGDRFWGCVWDKEFGWSGHNWLGTILMEERDKLRRLNV